MAISLTLFYGSPNAHNSAAASLGSIARASQKLNAIALSQFRVSLTAVLFLTSLAPCGADLAPVIHYAPGENLEHVDVALIDSAEREIDMAVCPDGLASHASAHARRRSWRPYPHLS
jgi:hypothetical protein